MTVKMHAPLNPSSHIHSIGYDEAAKTLHVKFHKGGTYTYHGIDKQTYTKLHGHESPGNFLSMNVKGLFQHSKN